MCVYGVFDNIAICGPCDLVILVLKNNTIFRVQNIVGIRDAKGCVEGKAKHEGVLQHSKACTQVLFFGFGCNRPES